MSDVTTTSFRLSPVTKARLHIMALAQGVSQSELIDEIANREFALRADPIIRPWAEISGLEGEIHIPDVDERFAAEEKPIRILEEAKKLRTEMEVIQRAEDAWTAATTPEGALDFVAALRNGDLSVVNGRITVPQRARTSKTFPDINIESGTWIYDFKRRSHFDSLTIPKCILEYFNIEDQTYGTFSITDESSGKTIAFRERFRISSGREMQITTKFRPKLAKLTKVRILYHGRCDE